MHALFLYTPLVILIVSQLCSDVIILLVLIGLHVERLQVYVVVVVELRSLVISTYKSALSEYTADFSGSDDGQQRASTG